jgi:hypothetical protein
MMQIRQQPFKVAPFRAAGTSRSSNLSKAGEPR